MIAPAVPGSLRQLQIASCAGSRKTENLAQSVAGRLARGVAIDWIVALASGATELKDRIARRVAEPMGAALHRISRRMTPLKTLPE